MGEKLRYPLHSSFPLFSPPSVLTACSKVAEPRAFFHEVGHAGSIFVGPYTPVACGVDVSGTTHVLPTSGYASVYFGLFLYHFCTRSQVRNLT
nr:histidinol dehydrogenase [Methanocalculus alkaliphilus]